MFTQAQLDEKIAAAVGTAKTASHAEGHAAGLAAGKTEGHVAGLAEGRALGLKDGAAAERTRLTAIRGSEEAKKRPKAAEHVALTTDMSVDHAKTFLAGLPEESVTAGTLDGEMTADRVPLVGADGKPLVPEAGKSSEQKAFTEGKEAAEKLLGKKA